MEQEQIYEQGPAEEMLTVLESMLGIYQRIAALEEEKQSVLAAGKPDLLAAAVREEGQLSAQIKELEQKRLSIQDKLADYGQTLAELTRDLPAPMKQRAAAVGGGLKKMLARIRLLSRINSEVISHVQNFFNYELNVAMQVKASPGYRRDCALNHPVTGQVLVDKRI
ncbi:flgn protein [Lucifera butyrica]|uniref:Flgn protein n=1 Tax=Lucifera butyrica TaxID=1351585 RepID=A0A498RD04_9FIRM|nr:flagellar export chaperone FlgN [Lucifera butyrica]VBB09434.1 flgn protein [Lucifera butyrica]